VKKFVPLLFCVALTYLAKTMRIKAYVYIAMVLLAGCTSTQVRWDATNIREQVMVYYNDQIMDNLIRARKKLPFVHVDITLLLSQGASQISGTIGSGETRTHTDSSSMGASVMGSLIGITKTVTRPFAWSVTPQQTETLSITAAPALGSQAVASLPSKKLETKKSERQETPETEVTKITETITKGSTSTTTEKTPVKPAPSTIYDLYEQYAKLPCEGGVLSDGPIRPREGAYVRGTLKSRDNRYYYIRAVDNEKYYTLCKALFTKGQALGPAGSLQKKLTEIEAQALIPH
jgi:hypothetical protein